MALGHSAACECVECSQARGGLGGGRVAGLAVEVHDGPPKVPASIPHECGPGTCEPPDMTAAFMRPAPAHAAHDDAWAVALADTFVEMDSKRKLLVVRRIGEKITGEQAMELAKELMEL